MRPLAVIGNLAKDVVDGGPPRTGGGPFHCARALRLVGGPARIVTKCAEADRALLRPLVSLGIPVRWRPAAATSSFSFTYQGDERLMRVEALGEPWRPAEAADVGDADWVHAAPLVRSDFPPETLAALARGRRLSLDGQGLVRPARLGRLVLDADYDPALLAPVSVLKLAEEEARVLGALDAEGLRRLGVPEVVVTLGSRGALVWAGGRLAEVPAPTVRRVVDPTGAGDAFSAVYAVSRRRGYTPVAAARRAAVAVAALLSA